MAYPVTSSFRGDKSSRNKPKPGKMATYFESGTQSNVLIGNGPIEHSPIATNGQIKHYLEESSDARDRSSSNKRKKSLKKGKLSKSVSKPRNKINDSYMTRV